MLSAMKKIENGDLCKSFAPAGDTETPEVLILGSMPGVESLRQGQYYAFKHNAFWRIAGILFDFDPALDYASRIAALKSCHVALWDVFQFCSRSGSADANIRAAIPNDLYSFISRRPTIKIVLGNGSAASAGFRRYFPMYNHLLRQVPSTSPAAAMLSFDEKLAKWRDALQN